MFLPFLCVGIKPTQLGVYYYLIYKCCQKNNNKINIILRDSAKEINISEVYLMAILKELCSSGLINMDKDHANSRNGRTTRYIVEIEDESFEKVITELKKELDPDFNEFSIDLSGEELLRYKAIKDWKINHQGKECPRDLLEKISQKKYDTMFF